MSDNQGWGAPQDPSQPGPGGAPVPPPGGAYPPPQSPQQPYVAPPAQPGPEGYGGVPQQQYQPGAAYQGAQPPKKKSSLWKWLLGIFLVGLIGIGGCSFVVFNALKGPVDRSNEFLAAVSKGDWADARARASESNECFGPGADTTLESFFGDTDLTSYNLNSTNVSSVNGESTATVSGQIGSNLGSYDIELLLVKEDGSDWLVCGIETSFNE